MVTMLKVTNLLLFRTILVYNVIIVLSSMVTSGVAKRRNILLIIADDLGWNDIGFHNKDVRTPVLDRLALSGVQLGQMYAQPMCTPSRSALMTGLYPFRVGQQMGVITPKEPLCAALGLVTLPQKLKQLQYATHLVGKWHLGMCNWNCTPTYRGFDSFYGFYQGAETYYTKTIIGGRDFRDNEMPVVNNEYSTYLYRDRAIDIIKSHDKSKPFFLVLSFQAPHTPLEVPELYENVYQDIASRQRRVYSGMITAMDEAIGKVQDALKDAGLMEDTLVIFTSDNGAMPSSTGNNLPLRGAKGSLFEGGTRVVAFVTGSGLENTGFTYNGMMHITDWFPTILEAAGNQHCDETIDGISHWRAIKHGLMSPRDELVYNVDINGFSAIRVGDYKLIQGYPGPFRDWYQVGEVFRPDLDPVEGNDGLVYFTLLREDMKTKPGVFQGVQLYDLKKDPEERFDISEAKADIVAQLSERLEIYRRDVVARPPMVDDPKSDPQLTGGFWTPGWC